MCFLPQNIADRIRLCWNSRKASIRRLPASVVSLEVVHPSSTPSVMVSLALISNLLRPNFMPERSFLYSCCLATCRIDVMERVVYTRWPATHYYIRMERFCRSKRQSDTHRFVMYLVVNFHTEYKLSSHIYLVQIRSMPAFELHFHKLRGRQPTTQSVLLTSSASRKDFSASLELTASGAGVR